MRVLISQPVVPHYRIPFFKKLCEQLDLQLIASKAVHGNPSTPNEASDIVYKFVDYKPLFFNQFAWQSEVVIPAEFKQGDVIVLCGNLRYLHNYRLIIQARRRNLGIVWWGHGNIHSTSIWKKKFRRKIMMLADILLLYTEREVESYIHDGFPVKKLVAANNTISTDDIDQAIAAWSPERLSNFKSEQELIDKNILLYCGRLTSKLDFIMLLDALAILIRHTSSYKLVIIGDGDIKADLEKYAENLAINHAIHWCGAIYQQNQVAPWFINADIFICPRGIGLSLMHSFAYSLPVITHDNLNSHGPEIAALSSGHNGLLYNKDSIDDLVEKIESLFNNPILRENMAANAYQTIKNNYSLDNMVKNFCRSVSLASLSSKEKL